MRGHVRKREGKRGSTWAYVLELDRTPDGKRRQSWKSGFASRRAAQAALTAALSELQSGTFTEPTKTTFGELLTRWLRDMVRPRRAPATVTTYESLIKNHLGGLAPLPLSKITPARLQELFADRLQSGLSPATVQVLRAICVTSLGLAVKWGLVSRNAATLTEGPPAAPPEIPVFSPAGVRAILAAVEGTPLAVPALLAAGTGLRRGEVLGLRWVDVDLTTGTLQVRQALKTRTQAEGGDYFGGPKSRKGRRTVMLVPANALTPEDALLVAALTAHREAQDRERERLAGIWQESGLVFPGADGRPWSPQAFSDAFAARMTAAGIRCRFHDLRHVHVSAMLAAGVPVNVVSERVGHATSALTLERYAHVLPGQQAQVAEKAEEALRTYLDAP